MTKLHKVAILGGGAFGVALSKLVAKKSSEVMLWARTQEVIEGINSNHRHPFELTEIELPKNIFATNDLSEASKNARYVVLAVPMSAMGEILEKAPIENNATVVCTAKGILSDSLEISADIIRKTLTKDLVYRACYLSGPSFAVELAKGLPTALTIASYCHESAREFQSHFSDSSCRLYWSNDVIGVCVGGAMKNVIAIAAGACVGLKLGHNALAALITRGLAEMTRLATKMGAESSTMSGLSGVGDLLLSCTDSMSRNHRLGVFLAEGLDLAEALKKVGTVVEGVKTARAIVPLSERYGIEMPISHAVFQVLYEGVNPKHAISQLLERAPKEERN